MSALIYPAGIDGIGRIRFDTPELVAAELSQLAGKRVTVRITREQLKRSAEQNAFLWAHVYTEAVAEGVELIELASGLPVFKKREDVHNFGKLNLLSKPVLTNRGELNLLGTTTTLSVSEFSEYIDRLVAKLAQYGICIPEMGR
jgi:hypothetical protein